MQFPLKTWFKWCVPLGLILAVLQRPLRTPEFVNGLQAAFYPWFWLCYCEEGITYPHNGPIAGMAGAIIGVLIQVFGITFGPPLIWHWIEQLKRRREES